MRSNYVKESITSALLELMAEKDFAKINITDIVEKAGVSRVTYYRHFADKEAVLSCYFDLIKEKFRNNVLQKVEQKDWKGVIVEVFKSFKEQKEAILLLRKAKVEYLYLEYVTEQCEQQAPNDKYFMDFIAGSFYNICMQWLANDCKDPIEEVAKPFFVILDLFEKQKIG